MEHRKVFSSGSGLFRVPVLAGLVVVLAIGVAPGQVAAADLSADVSVDSSIELTQKGSIGPHEVYSIVMTTRLGETTLVVGKDDQRSQRSMSYEACEKLWQYVLERDVGNMGDAPIENPMPDQAEFTFVFQNGFETHKFTAYGVDFLSDPRYREIARAILAIPEGH